MDAADREGQAGAGRARDGLLLVARGALAGAERALLLRGVEGGGCGGRRGAVSGGRREGRRRGKKEQKKEVAFSSRSLSPWRPFRTGPCLRDPWLPFRSCWKYKKRWWRCEEGGEKKKAEEKMICDFRVFSDVAKKKPPPQKKTAHLPPHPTALCIFPRPRRFFRSDGPEIASKADSWGRGKGRRQVREIGERAQGERRGGVSSQRVVGGVSEVAPSATAASSASLILSSSSSFQKHGKYSHSLVTK